MSETANTEDDERSPAVESEEVALTILPLHERQAAVFIYGDGELIVATLELEDGDDE